MSRLAVFCQKTSNSLERLCLFGAGMLLLINLATVMLGVFSRFFHPPMWTMDLAKVSLVWMVMFAAAPALKRGEHMAITMLVDRLPLHLRRYVVAIRILIFVSILVLMIFLGVTYAWKMKLFSIMSLGIKKSIPLMAIPIGLGFMLIEYTLQQFIPLGSSGNIMESKDKVAEERTP